MRLVYELLGENDRHALALHILHLREICQEILGLFDKNCLKDIMYISYVPSRLRGVAQALTEIYERFLRSVSENSKCDDRNVMKFKNNFSVFVELVSGLENVMDNYLYDNRNDSVIIKCTYDLVNFFQRSEFYVEDSES